MVMRSFESCFQFHKLGQHHTYLQLMSVCNLQEIKNVVRLAYAVDYLDRSKQIMVPRTKFDIYHNTLRDQNSKLIL